MRDRDLVTTDDELQLLDEERHAQTGPDFARYPRDRCTHSQWRWKRWGRDLRSGLWRLT
jgi:hypothetical protein